jgi:hypothetical protein
MSRWEHEELLEAMSSRWAPAPDSRRRRRQTVAHPFGTLQAGMGATYFPTQTIKKYQYGNEPARAGLPPQKGHENKRDI